MSRFVDLSHDFYDAMPGFIGQDAEGNPKPFTAHVSPLLTHEQSAGLYDFKAEFTMTEMFFQTSVGTYMDAPFVRYRQGRDIAALRLDELILPGAVVDLRGLDPGTAVGPTDLKLPSYLAGHALLLNFGWDQHFGTEAYRNYPFIHSMLIDHLVDRNIKIIGVDTGNIDDGADKARPAHSMFLEADILIVENLRNLDALHGQGAFRFYGLPIKTRGAGSMPVRAFAELLETPS